MKFTSKIVFIAVLGTLVSCNNKTSEIKTLETDIDSVSYALGLNMANQLNTGFPEFNREVFIQAIKDGKDSTNLLIEDKNVQTIINSFFQKKQKAEGEKNKKAGEDFLATNKDKDGVITTESGLQYIVMKEGNGKKPKPDSNIKIHYHGTTIDGVVFDSTVERNKPYEAKTSQFVSGFTEGLLLMNQGAKYKFFIPQELAYKSAARSAVIKPYSTLVFEVELLEVK